MVLPERTAVITFDDGLADFATYAWPELTARGLGATLYVTAGGLDGTGRWLARLGAAGLPMLTRRQVVELAAEGCEIGAHSMTHPQLNRLPRSAAAQEVTQSRAVLEHLLGQTVHSFAYPYGSYDAGVRQLVVDAGFHSAAAMNGLRRTGNDWFTVSRIAVTADFDVDRLTETLTGHDATVERPGKQRRTQPWRQVWRLRHRRPTDRKAVA